MGGLVGLVVAAGGGARFGGPKALARCADGEPWVGIAVRLLRGAGCRRVLVVLGAAAEEAASLVRAADGESVVADRWRDGMGASLAAGFAALPPADAVLVTLVDLPAMPPGVPERVLAEGTRPERLARAVYHGRPGHPVLIGRAHWPAFRDGLHGDEGGRAYLAAHGVEPIECADLFDGSDIDTS